MVERQGGAQVRAEGGEGQGPVRGSLEERVRSAPRLSGW